MDASPFISPELTVGLLTGVTVLAFGGAAIAVGQKREEGRVASQRAFQDHAKPSVPQAVAPLSKSVYRLGHAVAPESKTSRTLKEDLARAGFHGTTAAATYMGYKLLLPVLGVVLTTPALLWLQVSFVLGGYLLLTLAGGLFFVPNIYIGRRRDKRRVEFKRHLPDAVELLEICVSAGMGLDTAWNAVSDEIRSVSPDLADEMELTNLEISLGIGRPKAMRNMADRTGADEISSLVALLVQSERFGASVAEGLWVFTESLRETRIMTAEENAEKMAVRMLFPMVLCIFPPLLIVTVGPALVDLIEAVGASFLRR